MATIGFEPMTSAIEGARARSYLQVRSPSTLSHCDALSLWAGESCMEVRIGLEDVYSTSAHSMSPILGMRAIMALRDTEFKDANTFKISILPHVPSTIILS